MNKGVMWAVIAVVVVAAAGAYMFWGRGGGVATQSMATSTPTASFRELSASKTPQECNFTSANNSKGTLFIASGMVRGDFAGEAAGKTVSGHMVMRDNMSYVWMDGSTQGFKSSFEASRTTQQTVDPDENVTVSCKPWTPDQSKFVLPTDVTFMAVGEAQVKAGASAAGATCAQCNQIPDDTAKAQCLAAMHC